MNTINSSNAFNPLEYKKQLNEFPNITFAKFQQITDVQVRKDIVSKNKLIQTDAYNRTMNHIKGKERSKIQEAYTLSFRRAPSDAPNEPYVAVQGLREALKETFSFPITQQELDFAKDFYANEGKKGGVSYFDAEMRQEVVDNGGYLPLTIHAVPDGTLLKAGEPAMVVKWPSELAAIWEPRFLRTFFPTAWTSRNSMIAEVTEDGKANYSTKFTDNGIRSSVNLQAHFTAMESAHIGGGLIRTSNDAAACVYPRMVSSGTTAHRFFSSYATEKEAMRAAIERVDRITLLADLVDTEVGVENILDLKEEYRDRPEKVIYPRLDSGDIVAQGIAIFKKQMARWMMDPQRDKVAISEWIASIKAIQELEEAIKAMEISIEYLAYGSGDLLVNKGLTRGSVSAGFKLTRTEELGPTGKYSNDPEKQSTPGIQNIEIRDGARYIVQEDEEVKGKRLLQPVYENGKLFYGDDDLQLIKDARQQLLDTFQRVELPTKKSERTQQMQDQVRERLVGSLAQTSDPTQKEILPEQDKYGTLLNRIQQGMKEYLDNIGIQNIVIGVSGGIDSALNLYLLSKIYPPENIHAIYLPTKFNSNDSLVRSQKLCDNLGIALKVWPIQDLLASFEKFSKQYLGRTLEGSSHENVQSRIRSAVLMNIANNEKGGVINNTNETELGLGYITLGGDSMGVLCSLGDLNKKEIYSLSRYINEKEGWDSIPTEIIERPASAELQEGQVDPFDYDKISEPVGELLQGRPVAEVAQKYQLPLDEVQALYAIIQRNAFKRSFMPPILKLKD